MSREEKEGSPQINESKVKKHSDIGEVEELRTILKTVSEFLREIKDPLKDLLNILLESFSGDKLGKEVATFYRSLIEAGVDQSLAKTLTEKFMVERMKPLSSIGELLAGIRKGEKIKKAFEVAEGSEESGSE